MDVMCNSMSLCSINVHVVYTNCICVAKSMSLSVHFGINVPVFEIYSSYVYTSTHFTTRAELGIPKVGPSAGSYVYTRLNTKNYPLPRI